MRPDKYGAEIIGRFYGDIEEVARKVAGIVLQSYVMLRYRNLLTEVKV